MECMLPARLEGIEEGRCTSDCDQRLYSGLQERDWLIPSWLVVWTSSKPSGHVLYALRFLHDVALAREMQSDAIIKRKNNLVRRGSLQLPGLRMATWRRAMVLSVLHRTARKVRISAYSKLSIVTGVPFSIPNGSFFWIPRSGTAYSAPRIVFAASLPSMTSG